jgi:hypothetical protein
VVLFFKFIFCQFCGFKIWRFFQFIWLPFSFSDLQSKFFWPKIYSQFFFVFSLAIFQIYLASLLLLFQVYTFKNEKFQKIPIFLAKE